MNKHKKSEKTWDAVANHFVKTGIVNYASFKRTNQEDGNSLYLEYKLNQGLESEMRVLVGSLRNLIMHNIPEIQIHQDPTENPPRIYFKPYQSSQTPKKKVSKQRARELMDYLAQQEKKGFTGIVSHSIQALQSYQRPPESPQTEHSLLQLIDKELENHYYRK